MIRALAKSVEIQLAKVQTEMMEFNIRHIFILSSTIVIAKSN